MLQRPKRPPFRCNVLGGGGLLGTGTLGTATKTPQETHGNATGKPRETPGLPFGELFRERRNLRGDLRLLRRAIREGWPIPETSREALVRAVADNALGEELNGLAMGTYIRASLRACWVFLEMEEDNRAAEYAEAGLKFRPVLSRRRRCG